MLLGGNWYVMSQYCHAQSLRSFKNMTRRKLAMWIALSLIGTGALAAATAALVVVGHRRLDSVLASFGCSLAHE